MVPLVRHVIALVLTLSLQSSFSPDHLSGHQYQRQRSWFPAPGRSRCERHSGKGQHRLRLVLSNSTIVLTSGHLRVTEQVGIDAALADNLAINGNWDGIPKSNTGSRIFLLDLDLPDPRSGERSISRT